MTFDDQISEIKKYFGNIEVGLESEGGCRFIRLPSFFYDPEGKSSRLECLFSCDNHLGYESRLWFPKIIKTLEQRNWNHKDTYILGSTWNAFSYKAKGTTLLEKLLSHLAGIK